MNLAWRRPPGQRENQPSSSRRILRRRLPSRATRQILRRDRELPWRLEQQMLRREKNRCPPGCHETLTLSASVWLREDRVSGERGRAPPIDEICKKDSLSRLCGCWLSQSCEPGGHTRAGFPRMGYSPSNPRLPKSRHMELYLP